MQTYAKPLKLEFYPEKKLPCLRLFLKDFIPETLKKEFVASIVLYLCCIKRKEIYSIQYVRSKDSDFYSL